MCLDGQYPTTPGGRWGALSVAADDRYVDSSTVVVGAKLLETGAEAVLVFCDAEFTVQVVCSPFLLFTGLLLPCVYCSVGFVGAVFGVSSCRQGLEVAERLDAGE